MRSYVRYFSALYPSLSKAEQHKDHFVLTKAPCIVAAVRVGSTRYKPRQLCQSDGHSSHDGTRRRLSGLLTSESS